MDELSEHFSSAHRNHLRIIVEAPPTRKYFRDLFIFTLILILSLSSRTIIPLPVSPSNPLYTRFLLQLQVSL